MAPKKTAELDADALALAALVAALPTDEKNRHLVDVGLGKGAEVKAELLRLLRAGMATRQERSLRAAADEARDQRLKALGRHSAVVWHNVEAGAASGQVKRYDEAAQLLLDLQELAGRRGREAAFRQRLQELLRRHGTKELTARLARAGLPVSDR